VKTTSDTEISHNCSLSITRRSETIKTVLEIIKSSSQIESVETGRQKLQMFFSEIS